MPIHSKKPVEAKRVGASLVASFHRADPPLVWRFDLQRNHSFTLSINDEGGRSVLGIASPDTTFKTIATFAQRKDADEALMVVENVLAKGEPSWLALILKPLAILTLVVVIAVLIFFAWIGSKTMHQTSRGEISEQPLPVWPAPATAPYEQPKPPAKPAMKSGVPLPADDYLTPPQ